MALEIQNIKAIIFDLGDVIIRLDKEASIHAFALLNNKSFEEIINIYENAEFFKSYETGAISDAEFRQKIRNELDIKATDEQIDKAWNTILQDIPFSRIEAFENLKKKFKLFVMSNTNPIHIRKFIEKFDQLSPYKSFRDYFDKVYFSPEIGARKPNANAWEPILEEYNLTPEKTLFIDDLKENIEAAKKLGLQTFHNKGFDDWLGLLAL